MNSKSILVAIAAYAVTAAGAQAYWSPQLLTRAGLTEVQVEAMASARDLRQRGKSDEARDRLLEAGVNEETMMKLRAMNNQLKLKFEAVVKANDFIAFREIVAGTPLADIVTTEADFSDFRTAHLMRLQSRGETSHALAGKDKTHHYKKPGHRSTWWNQLTPDERDAYIVAKQANDRETMDTILQTAGVEKFRARNFRSA